MVGHEGLIFGVELKNTLREKNLYWEPNTPDILGTAMSKPSSSLPITCK